MQTKTQQERKPDICTQAYNLAADFILQFGYPPTVRELGELMGGKSTSLVKGYLETLRDWGWVRFEDGKARTLRLARPAALDQAAIREADRAIEKAAANRSQMAVVAAKRERDQAVKRAALSQLFSSQRTVAK